MSSALPLPDDSLEPEGGTAGILSPELLKLQSARREMAFQSLLELGRGLTVALDVYETTDLLLFNLMGQLGTSRTALWLTPEPGAGSVPVLVRAHGFRRAVIEAVGSNCAPALDRRFQRDPTPFLSWARSEELSANEFELLRLMGIAMFAPLLARGERLGWLAVGTRLDGSAYTEDDVEVLRATLGMAAVSLQNTHLYNRERESNRRLRSANDHLRELDRLKNEFLSNVNHELRTPLAVVIATLDTLTGERLVDPSVRGLLDASLEQSLKLKELIENLLSFSEASADRLTVDVRPGDANALLELVYRERLPGISAGLRELIHEPCPGLPLAGFDPQRVRTILNELLDNAAKFTPRGSKLTLRSGRVSADGETWVALEAVDDGPGIPAEHLAGGFTAFRQGDGSSTRSAGGLGMGLALARALAEKMGGRLEIENRPGSGCAVRLLLKSA